MNSIVMIVLAVVILLLVFVLFSLDDHEDETDFLDSTDVEQMEDAPAKESVEKNRAAVVKIQPPPEPKNSIKPVPVAAGSKDDKLPATGNEEDMRFRITLDQTLPLPRTINKIDAVVAAVQLRFPEEILQDHDAFLKNLIKAEQVLEKEFSFEFSCYPSGQLDRMWYFASDEGRDDALFEALVVAFEVISRFKKALEHDSALRDARVRLAVGLSKGTMLKVNRGIAAVSTWIGKPAFMAETLAEAAGDFTIYVDEDVHKAALPLFDFREWKPVKLRSSLPLLPIFELVGWNKPEEVASFANHQEPYARRAVAIAYRYLELDSNMQPLNELLSDPDEGVALAALETVRAIGNESSLGLLKRIFPETADAGFRSAILDAFGGIGKNEVVPVILGSTKEGSWKVRLSAARALYKLSGKDSLRHLEHLLEDPDGGVKSGVNAIFFRETGKEQFLVVLDEMLSDLSQRARKVAADELLKLDSEKALKVLSSNFVEQEIDLQKQILRGLETSKSPILYQCFLKIFKASGEIIRPSIIESIRRAGLVS